MSTNSPLRKGVYVQRNMQLRAKTQRGNGLVRTASAQNEVLSAVNRTRPSKPQWTLALSATDTQKSHLQTHWHASLCKLNGRDEMQSPVFMQVCPPLRHHCSLPQSQWVSRKAQEPTGRSHRTPTASGCGPTSTTSHIWMQSRISRVILCRLQSRVWCWNKWNSRHWICFSFINT